MPYQTYECSVHGEFLVRYSYSEDVRKTEPCLVFVSEEDGSKHPCLEDAPWRPPTDTRVSVHRYGNELI